MERAVEHTALSRNRKFKKKFLKNFFSEFLRRFLTFSYVVKDFFKYKNVLKMLRFLLKSALLSGSVLQIP